MRLILKHIISLLILFIIITTVVKVTHWTITHVFNNKEISFRIDNNKLYMIVHKINFN